MNDRSIVQFVRGLKRPRYSTTQLCVCAAILAMGAMQFGLTVHSSDFFAGDATYYEAARSLASGHGLLFDFQPETTLPPGLPAMLAGLCLTLGCSYAISIHSIVVCSTLGLLAAYELLRREQSRSAAVVICLLLASSPVWFRFETRFVFSDLPYLLTSMVTLLLFDSLDEATSANIRSVTWLLGALTLVGSILIRSAGVALVVGVIAWLGVTSLTNRAARRRRLLLFVPLLVPAVIAQASWSRWAAAHEVREWPIGGYPRSYVEQLHVKNGNRPELGTASLSDIPPRIGDNAEEHVAGFIELFTRVSWVNPVWSSPLVLLPLILILIGWISSIRPEGGRVTEWYFAAHQAIYLMWPWDLEIRFLIPVAPLAGLYLWRGGKALRGWVERAPREAAAWALPIFSLLAVHATLFAWRTGSRQLTLAAILWVVVALAAGRVLLADRAAVLAIAKRLELLTIRVSWPSRSMPALVAGGVLLVASQVTVGVAEQAIEGHDNVSFDIRRSPLFGGVEAGQWIAAHTNNAAVVMARQVDVVFHYSKRKVVWFPPISNAQTLMKGIREHDVQLVVVVHPASSYWLPTEDDCFAALIRAFPQSFRLVVEDAHFKIFEVVGTADYK